MASAASVAGQCMPVALTARALARAATAAYVAVDPSAYRAATVVVTEVARAAKAVVASFASRSAGGTADASGRSARQLVGAGRVARLDRLGDRLLHGQRPARRPRRLEGGVAQGLARGGDVRGLGRPERGLQVRADRLAQRLGGA